MTHAVRGQDLCAGLIAASRALGREKQKIGIRKQAQTGIYCREQPEPRATGG